MEVREGRPYWPKKVTARTPGKIFVKGRVTATHLDEIGGRQRRASEAYSRYTASTDAGAEVAKWVCSYQKRGEDEEAGIYQSLSL